MAAVDRPEALFDAPNGWRARWALRAQLVAVEARGMASTRSRSLTGFFAHLSLA